MADLDFEKADFGPSPQQPICVVCKTAISDTYFTANGAVVCPNCRDGLMARPSGFSGPEFLRALLYGAAMAALGSGVWYGVTRATGYEFGLLAIGIGIVVGKAVQRGSGFRAGAAYPALAVALTYLSIVGATALSVLMQPHEDLDFGMFFLLVIASPFLGGFKNVIGLVIIGFGLYEAWKYARVAELTFAGPFQL